jgi:transporter family-2 protein
LLLTAVVVAGGLLGLQGRINGELGRRVHSAIDAATISFGVGTLVLLAVVGTSRRRELRRLRPSAVRWWWWLGGLAGAVVVATTAEGVPQIGVALVSVCIVAGTAVGALLVDEIGLGPGGRQSVSLVRLAGAALAVGAVALGAIGGHGTVARPALFAGLFAAGAGSAWQQAGNGQLRRISQSTPVASFVSFLGGTIGLVIAASVQGDLSGRSWPQSWWLYIGGLLGAVYIALAASVVGRLGVLRLSLATVAGQLVGAVLLDAVWPAPGIELRATTVVGAALTLLAVAVSGLGRRRAVGTAVTP